MSGWQREKEPKPGSQPQELSQILVALSGGTFLRQINNFNQGSSFGLRTDFIGSSRKRMAFTHRVLKSVFTLRQCKHMFQEDNPGIMGIIMCRRARLESEGGMD